MKLSDQNVQIISSRNEILDELYQKYAPLISPQSSERIAQNCERLYKDLSNDAAITSLLPYFRAYLTKPYNINEDEKTIVNSFQEKINLIRALFNNPNISLDSDLTQFIGVCLSALTISFKDPLFEYTTLRENAALMIKDIVSKYSESYPDLYSRTVDQLVSIYLEKKHFPMKMGAAIGISIVAPEFVKLVIIPKIPQFMELFKESKNISDEQRIQFYKFRAVLMKICGDSFSNDLKNSDPKGTLSEEDAEMYNKLIPYFGTDFFKYSAPM